MVAERSATDSSNTASGSWQAYALGGQVSLDAYRELNKNPQQGRTLMIDDSGQSEWAYDSLCSVTNSPGVI